jgi:hypothetical protein
MKPSFVVTWLFILNSETVSLFRDSIMIPTIFEVSKELETC